MHILRSFPCITYKIIERIPQKRLSGQLKNILGMATWVSAWNTLNLNNTNYKKRTAIIKKIYGFLDLHFKEYQEEIWEVLEWDEY